MKTRYLIGGFLLLTLSFWVNTHFYRPSLELLTQGKSAGFQGNGIPDPLTPPGQREITSFDQQESIFEIAVDPASQSINLQFLYQAPADSVVYLSILDKSQAWIPFLVEHPLLHSLKWFYALDEPSVIYQRNFTYSTLEALTKLVPASEILTEQQLEHTFSADSYNYIVTARQPQGKFGDWWWFRKGLLLHEAFRETDGTIYMKITTSKTPLLMARQQVILK